MQSCWGRIAILQVENEMMKLLMIGCDEGTTEPTIRMTYIRGAIHQERRLHSLLFEQVFAIFVAWWLLLVVRLVPCFVACLQLPFTKKIIINSVFIYLLIWYIECYRSIATTLRFKSLLQADVYIYSTGSASLLPKVMEFWHCFICFNPNLVCL